MAMVLGIYDRLISSVSRVFKEPKQSIPFLLWFALGGAGGILLFSRGISLLLSSRWEVPARFFFLGAVGGGIPLIFKEAGIKRFGSGDAVFVATGRFRQRRLRSKPVGEPCPRSNSIHHHLDSRRKRFHFQ
jgi:putative membrane protein